MQFTFYKFLLDCTLQLYNQHKEKQIQLLVEENCNLLNINVKTFMYQGKWYPNISTHNTKYLNRKLHYSLIPEIEKIINQDFRELEFTAIMQNFCFIIMNNIFNINDLQKILPNELFKLVSHQAENYFELYEEQVDAHAPIIDRHYNAFQLACKPGLVELAKLRIIKSFNI